QRGAVRAILALGYRRSVSAAVRSAGEPENGAGQVVADVVDSAPDLVIDLGLAGRVADDGDDLVHSRIEDLVPLQFQSARFALSYLRLRCHYDPPVSGHRRASGLDDSPRRQSAPERGAPSDGCEQTDPA